MNPGSKETCWQLRGGRRLEPAPFIIAGIVNVTPDSFSDGGRYVEPEQAMERVRQVIAEGAHMVDLGAESTRPGARDVGHAEEWKRLRPVLERTLALRTPPEDCGHEASGATASFRVSVDTFRADTAAKALELFAPCGGLDVINDVSGCSFDPALAEVLASFKPGYVLGHSPARPGVMQDKPCYDNVVEELLDWFVTRMNLLIKAGLPESCIVLDPCIGFGKTLNHTVAIFSALDRFQTLGRPLYFGISRKRFLGEITGLATVQRDTATQVVTALLASRGVLIHRVHNVAETMATLNIVTAMRGHVC